MSKANKLIVTLLIILVAFSGAVGTISAVGQLELKKAVEKNNTELTERIDKLSMVRGEDPGTEDDVLILDEYTIRSTTQISDAYKSGDTSALSDRDKETLDMAKAVLDEIITDGMTDYEKEEAAYLWLTKSLKPDTGLLDVIPSTADGVDNPYGVLKNHEAVCVGYATTMRLFMQMLDIECKVIHSSDLVHSWNLVHLEDGWYHVDCYSDQENGSFANFNMNDTQARVNHDWNAEFFPAANGTQFSYAALHAVQIKNIYSIPKAVKKMLEKEESVGCFTFKEKITPENEAAAGAMVDTIVERLNSIDEMYLESAWSKDANDDYVLSVYVSSNIEDEEDDVDEATREKIDEAVDNALGDYIAEHQGFYDEEMNYEEDYDYEEATDASDEIMVDSAMYDAMMEQLDENDWSEIEARLGLSEGPTAVSEEEPTTGVEN